MIATLNLAPVVWKIDQGGISREGNSRLMAMRVRQSLPALPRHESGQ